MKPCWPTCLLRNLGSRCLEFKTRWPPTLPLSAFIGVHRRQNYLCREPHGRGQPAGRGIAIGVVQFSMSPAARKRMPPDLKARAAPAVRRPITGTIRRMLPIDRRRHPAGGFRPSRPPTPRNQVRSTTRLRVPPPLGTATNAAPGRSRALRVCSDRRQRRHLPLSRLRLGGRRTRASSGTTWAANRSWVSLKSPRI